MIYTKRERESARVTITVDYNSDVFSKRTTMKSVTMRLAELTDKEFKALTGVIKSYEDRLIEDKKLKVNERAKI